MKRQQGFGMLDMVFALALAGTLFVAYAGFMQRQKVEFDTQNYAKRIEHLIDALQRYHYQQKLNDADTIYHFPSELNDIITPEEQFWLNCTVADEQARYCARPDYVPWTTQRIDYIAGEKQVTLKHGLRVIAYAELTFPLSAITPEYRARWASPLLALPYAKRLANGDVKVSVYDPLLSQLYDEFLQRDGSVPLTGDWDVGGDKALINSRDYTIANSDNTQKLVSEGLTDVHVVKHGDEIPKPSCPNGMSPDIALSISNIEIEKEFELTGSQKTYIPHENNQLWQVGLEVRVRELSTGEFGSKNDGSIVALVKCR